jgi:hypothetical protein
MSSNHQLVFLAATVLTSTVALVGKSRAKSIIDKIGALAEQGEIIASRPLAFSNITTPYLGSGIYL